MSELTSDTSKGASNRLPPAQIVKQLFERQQIETRALRSRVEQLESKTKWFSVGTFTAFAILSVILIYAANAS